MNVAPNAFKRIRNIERQLDEFEKDRLDYDQVVSKIWDELPDACPFEVTLDESTHKFIQKERKTAGKQDSLCFIATFKKSEIHVEANSCTFIFPREEITVTDEQSLNHCLRKLNLTEKFGKD